MADRRQRRTSFSGIKKKSENDAKTQISLEQGTGEYKEFVMDQKGMDEFEQERHRADEAGLVKADEFQKDDKWHADEAAEAAAINPERDAAYSQQRRFHYDHTVERKQNRRILKGLLVDDFGDAAMDIAEATPSTDDDEVAKGIVRRLPKLVESEVHNDGIMIDEFIPHALEKYM